MNRDIHDQDDNAQPSVDLTAVRRDDDFLDSLAAGRPVAQTDPAEAELGALLFAWRTEALGAPMPAAPTVDDVEQAIAADAADHKRRSTVRHLRVLSGAAALAGVAAAGLLVLSEGSEPGDPLWGVKKVVFAEEARQTEATVAVQSTLEEAEQALARGDVDRSQVLIAKAQSELGPVTDQQTRDRMNQWIKRLSEDDDKSPAKTTTADRTKRSTQSPTSAPTDSVDPSTSVTVQVPPTSTTDPTIQQTTPNTPEPTSEPSKTTSSSSSSSSSSPSRTPASATVSPAP